MWEELTVEFLLYLTLAASLIAPVTSPLGRRENVAPVIVAAIGVGSFATLAGLLLYATASAPVQFYGGLVVQDSFTSLLLLGAALAAITYMIAIGVEGLQWASSPSLYSLIPLTLFGSFFLAGAADLLVILASWLLVSVVSYVVIASSDVKEAKGAAVRYAFVGIVATLILAASLAFYSIASGSYVLSLTPLSAGSGAAREVAALSVILLLAALGFKVGLFPFHWWLPSVYGRGDGRTVSFVAAVVKLAFIAVLGRALLVLSYGSPLAGDVALTVAVLAVATMTYGNVAAFTSRDLQVILAYSSMAQVGYILAALAAAAYFAGNLELSMLRLALYAVALQSIAYAIAKAPLFAFTGSTARELERLRGLMGVSPTAAVSASVLLYSLLGVPPLLGFWGKLYLFLSTSGYTVWLTLAALINSGVSAVYYIIASRELLTKQERPPTPPAMKYKIALAIAALLILVLGIVAPLFMSSLISVYL
ncbi:MAG: NADH-quinone oxidoreductase subunit NuoN [Acidilobus sp.]|nr:NADH-quinone oxidoreductase subunit NuoN [Acidilobus sp.]MCG2890241.1 NADH-quinone oxidoreductase subunit NuoN [Acidilobus sp.]MCG2891346.1 NADH-quinone oxidoreductase subunit NuoN [Acidilobus sp.]